MAADRNTIYHEIDEERANQDDQWGGPSHDDQHDSLLWHAFIYNQLRKAEDDVRGMTSIAEATPYLRSRYVKIAALAVAGIESIDRNDAV